MAHRLTPAEYHVLRQAGTERPFTGEYTDTKTEGVYECPRLRSRIVPQHREIRVALRVAVVLRPGPVRGGDPAPRRLAGYAPRRVLCANCHSHLGHVFAGRLPHPTDQRYCIARFRCGWCRPEILQLAMTTPPNQSHNPDEIGSVDPAPERA